MPIHSHRHDVYDDTRYGPQGAIDYPHDEYNHRRAARRHHRHRNDPYYDYPGPQHHPVAPMPLTPFHPMDPWALGPAMDPFYPMDPYLNRGEQQMDNGITPFPAPNLFRGMMTSFDRLWDEMTSSVPHPSTFQNHSGSHYYYESKTRTVGPDGRVHEETVRTVPGVDGQPETRRTVREGEHNSRMHSVFDSQIPHPALPHHHPYGTDSDVVVEELDEDGNVIRDDSPTRRRSRSSRDEDERHHRAYQNDHSDNWFRNQYRRWRSRD